MSIWFHHPGLVVPDLEAASRFYCQALGYEFVKSFGWEPDAVDAAQQITGVANSSAIGHVLKGANGFLELFQFHSPESTKDPENYTAADHGIAHLAFQVSDMQASFERFVSAGGFVHNHPVRVGDGYSIYCRDPFGNIIELMQIGSDEPDFDLRAERLLPSQT